jgi:hypothetical protein
LDLVDSWAGGRFVTEAYRVTPCVEFAEKQGHLAAVQDDFSAEWALEDLEFPIGCQCGLFVESVDFRKDRHGHVARFGYLFECLTWIDDIGHIEQVPLGEDHLSGQGVEQVDQVGLLFVGQILSIVKHRKRGECLLELSSVCLFERHTLGVGKRFA